MALWGLTKIAGKAECEKCQVIVCLTVSTGYQQVTNTMHV